MRTYNFTLEVCYSPRHTEYPVDPHWGIDYASDCDITIRDENDRRVDLSEELMEQLVTEIIWVIEARTE